MSNFFFFEEVKKIKNYILVFIFLYQSCQIHPMVIKLNMGISYLLKLLNYWEENLKKIMLEIH